MNVNAFLKLGLIGFELGLFFTRLKAVSFLYTVVLYRLTFIRVSWKLGLFCIFL